MNLPFYIAWRYFLSKKKIGYVHLLSFITQIGIAIGTAALVIVLSVFNGFENLVLSMYNVFDPHLKISSSEGKTFNSKEINEFLLTKDEIAVFSSILEEKVLVEYNAKQHIGRNDQIDSSEILLRQINNQTSGISSFFTQTLIVENYDDQAMTETSSVVPSTLSPPPSTTGIASDNVQTSPASGQSAGMATPVSQATPSTGGSY